jgi:hypothetical protein
MTWRREHLPRLSSNADLGIKSKNSAQIRIANLPHYAAGIKTAEFVGRTMRIVSLERLANSLRSLRIN